MSTETLNEMLEPYKKTSNIPTFGFLEIFIIVQLAIFFIGSIFLRKGIIGNDKPKMVLGSFLMFVSIAAILTPIIGIW